MFNKSQKENYPLLDSIVSNMQQNSNMSQLSEFLQNIQDIPQALVQQSGLEPCSKHQEKKGQYFQSEIPWVKYCQSCALNLALCGKKIQKSLNSEQMLTKIKLCETLQSVSLAIKQSEQGHQEFSFLSSELQQSRQWFVSILGQIDGFISQMTQIRNILQQNVQIYINKEIKEIFEKQSLMVSKKIQLINQKSQIQCGFVDLIGKANQANAFSVIQKANKLIKQSGDLISNQYYKSSLSQSIRNVQALFQQKLSQIKDMQLKSSLYQTRDYNINEKQRMSVLFSKKLLDYHTSKTQNALDDDISYQQGKRLLTACSTIQHSGLVTPCQMNNEKTPLGQLNQNRRSSRATLQLKTRCRSKSGQKKVDVNVRENIQNAVRKKLI